MVYNLATVVYSDIPRQTVVYQLYTTARGFDIARAKCYTHSYVYTTVDICTMLYNIVLPLVYIPLLRCVDNI